MTSIYTIKNLINGKVYVGKAHSPFYRFQHHLNALRRGKHSSKSLQRDFIEYGESAFSQQTLFTLEDDDEAKRMEVFMMKVLKSQNPQHGYNDSDKIGTSQTAIASGWRLPTRYWSGCGKARLHEAFPETYNSIDWNRQPKVNDRYA